jgi:threonyl-tRNA synthetase
LRVFLYIRLAAKYEKKGMIKMIQVTLKDGSKKEYRKGITIKEVAQDISAGLARVVLAGEVDGKVMDLSAELHQDCTLHLLTFDDEGGKHALRHTASHVLAQAVKHLYPNAKLAIGPAIDTGFYYDFDVEKPFSVEDLEKIEAEMQKIVKEDIKLERFTLSRDEAIKFMEERNEPYKVELINDLPEGETISFYKQGDFTDLCAGPHAESTGKVKAFKLLSVAGAYWRGSEKNKMLQRIYGTAFTKKSDLDDYLFRLEEARKRDHRKLGRELDLFDIYEEGPGFPFFMPKGMVLRNILESYWRDEHKKRNYQEIRTPIILNEELWHRSGHWDHYKDNMYFTKIDEHEGFGALSVLPPIRLELSRSGGIGPDGRGFGNPGPPSLRYRECKAKALDGYQREPEYRTSGTTYGIMPRHRHYNHQRSLRTDCGKTEKSYPRAKGKGIL